MGVSCIGFAIGYSPILVLIVEGFLSGNHLLYISHYGELQHSETFRKTLDLQTFTHRRAACATPIETERVF